VTELSFDEDVAKQLEAVYQTADAVRRRRLVRGKLAARPGERILDVGCGPGFYCAELLDEVGSEGSVVGLDMSEQMLALAARRCEGRGNVAFHRTDATSLPVPDASFDGAVCVQVLEYVADVPAALTELHRVLRPGGRAVVWDVDWSTVSWHSANPARMERILTAWDRHLIHPTLPRTLAPAMRAAGFDDVKMEAHPFATSELNEDAYGVALMPVLRAFVSGLGEIDPAELDAWDTEQRELGARGEFFFSCAQFCFSGRRAA
jgi:arsenite methyltransferase